MNIPPWFFQFIVDQFNGAQVEFINNNWHKYTQISFSNSTREQLLEECKSVLYFMPIENS